MCKVTDSYSRRKKKNKEKKQKKKKIENYLLTFPKWIICTCVLMTSLNFSTPLI